METSYSLKLSPSGRLVAPQKNKKRTNIPHAQRQTGWEADAGDLSRRLTRHQMRCAGRRVPILQVIRYPLRQLACVDPIRTTPATPLGSDLSPRRRRRDSLVISRREGG